MIFWSNEGGHCADREHDAELGALTSELLVHMLSGSQTGCLVQSSRALAVGTVATLRATLLGREYTDYVQVVRCQWIPGAGGTYHVGMQFLPTACASPASLRQAIHREAGRLTGRLESFPDDEDTGLQSS